MVGFFEKNASKDAVSQKFLDESENAGIIKYLGRSDHIEETLLKADCVVLPSSYREGTPRSLLEACNGHPNNYNKFCRMQKCC